MDKNGTRMCVWGTAFLIFSVLGLGCVERTMSINTEPQGATVMLNDQDVGKSPVKVPFTWYGDYDIVLRKPGYKTVKTHKRVNAPWYQWPVIDIFSEALIPVTMHDEQDLGTFAMETQVSPSKEQLLSASEELKNRASSADVEP
jgi:hypothetical protein